MPIDADDLARTALVDLVPRHPYRLAGRTDERFSSFAPLCLRVAFQHLGSRPSLLLFCGPGQDPREAARLAGRWAEANWRPSRLQRRVVPSVVAVHIAPGPQLAQAGPVEGAGVQTVVWTVDADRGRVDAPNAPHGGPSARLIHRATRRLAAGKPAEPVGALDVAERGIMQVRRRSSFGRVPGLVGMVVALLGLRFGFTVFGDVIAGRWLALPRDLLLFAAVAGAAALIFDYRGLRDRLPGFSSSRRWVSLLSWAGYIAVVAVAASLLGLLIPLHSSQA